MCRSKERCYDACRKETARSKNKQTSTSHNQSTLNMMLNTNIAKFHHSISTGPLYVCSSCHQTWFRESVRDANTLTQSDLKSQCLTDYVSVNDQEWICHNCFNCIKNNKLPKLSAANNVKFPPKPEVLNLHPLEE